MVVAIDGPSGVGKSTAARAAAAALGIPHLDTGVYYRLATLICLVAGVDPGDDAGVLAALEGVEIDFGPEGRILLDGVDVSERLRAPDVTGAVSLVSAHPLVRAALVGMQRAWVAARGGDAVVEGRDIGTVVFPDAPVKVFLTADVTVRARRRARDAEAAGADLDDLAAQIMRRDHLDSSRAASPLRPADDAVIIDTSHVSTAEVVRRILDLVGAV
ncbi:MAG TPA: (d)CMP kinase [Acidimicrobiia bacterium]|nr:(d)CMP kinase [Acidimicrobiia bacterium]